MSEFRTRRTRGGNVDKLGRGRAEAIYRVEQPCAVCGKAGKGRGVIDRHHVSGDRLDNSPANIAFLCRRHHHDAHRVLDGRIGGGARPRITAMLRDRAREQSDLARRLHAGGMPVKEVAATLGVHPESVRRWWRKYPPSAGIVKVSVTP